MTEHRVVKGNLVEVRNVNNHKVARFWVDVPAEEALDIINKLGSWPTMVNPIPVAVARLTAPVEPVQPAPPQEPEKPVSEVLKPKGGRLAQQAGMACSDKLFQHFLHDEHDYGIRDADEAKRAVYEICEIDSLAWLDHDPKAAVIFDKLMADFEAWKRCL